MRRRVNHPREVYDVPHAEDLFPSNHPLRAVKGRADRILEQGDRAAVCAGPTASRAVRASRPMPRSFSTWSCWRSGRREQGSGAGVDWPFAKGRRLKTWGGLRMGCP